MAVGLQQLLVFGACQRQQGAQAAGVPTLDQLLQQLAEREHVSRGSALTLNESMVLKHEAQEQTPKVVDEKSMGKWIKAYTGTSRCFTFSPRLKDNLRF